MPFPAPAEAYHAIEPWMAVLEARAHEAGVEGETIGETVLGRPIRAFTVPAAEGEERTVLVFAGIHPMEWISVECAGQFLLDLLVAPDPHATVTVIPILNVDGRLASEADVAAGFDVYHRGNGADPPVDLNRDFAVHHRPKGLWARVLPAYAASSPRAMSQPETRAIDQLARRVRFDRAASLHAFGGYVYWPWAGRWERPPDWGAFAALGRQMEAAEGVHAYRSKQLARWGFFFRAHGTEIDHLYGRYGTLAFLVELTRSGIDPRHLRRSVTNAFEWYNPADPAPHVERGIEALRALVSADP